MDAPAILLITDAYARGWRARSERGERFDVLPANYVLRAVALPAGKRRVWIEYSPTGWRIGRWVSAAFFAALLLLGWKKFTARS